MKYTVHEIGGLKSAGSLRLTGPGWGVVHSETEKIVATFEDKADAEEEARQLNSGTTPETIWEKLSPGRRSLAQDLASAALDGAGVEIVDFDDYDRAAEAVAFKLWFLLWEGKSRD